MHKAEPRRLPFSFLNDKEARESDHAMRTMVKQPEPQENKVTCLTRIGTPSNAMTFRNPSVATLSKPPALETYKGKTPKS